MKAIAKEDMHVALDGIHVIKYKEGDILEANSEFEKAYMEGLLLNEKVVLIQDKPSKKAVVEDNE